MPIRNWGYVLNQFMLIFDKKGSDYKCKPLTFLTYTLLWDSVYKMTNLLVKTIMFYDFFCRNTLNI